jgi:hypothetical protein
MKVIGISGIHSTGKRTTDRLLYCLDELGYETHDVNQPKRNIWSARFKYRKDAKAILDIAEDGDVAVCHSYGGLKAAIAMKKVKFRAVFMFRPAMSRWHRFGKSDTDIYCMYSHADWAVWGGSALLIHPFGLAGALGFKSRYVTNIGTQGGHSEDFKHTQVAYWALFIDNKLRAMR